MGLRSTGCRRCVGRRIKCDETRPSCRKCGIANLQCDGPPEPAGFVIETQHTMAMRSLSNIRCTSSGHSDHGSPPDPLIISSPSAFTEILYWNFFLETLFANSGAKGSDPGGDYEANKIWMTWSLSHQEQYPLSALALRCLSAGYFARIHHQDSTKKEAMKMYGKVLIALADQLKDPGKARSFDALAAVSVLNIYETVAFLSQKGWIHHCQGAAKLIELRGPGGFSKQRERSLFVLTRQYLLHEAMIAHKRTFLEQEEWLNVCRQNGGTDLEMIQDLISLYIRLPGLAEDVTRLQQERKIDCSSPSAEYIQRTKTALLRLTHDLKAWHVQWEEEPRRLPTSSSRLLDDEDPNQSPFSTIFTYQSLDFAFANCQWNSVMIHTHKWRRLLCELETQSRGRNPDSQKNEANEIVDVAEHAWNICLSIDYHLLPQHALQGSQYVLVAACTAYKVMPPGSRIAQWLTRVLETIASKHGFELAREVLDKPP